MPPPAVNLGGAASEFKQCFDALIFFDKACNGLLCHTSALVAAFIPLFVTVCVFPVEEPFRPLLPGSDPFGELLKFHVYSFLHCTGNEWGLNRYAAKKTTFPVLKKMWLIS